MPNNIEPRRLFPIFTRNAPGLRLLCGWRRGRRFGARFSNVIRTSTSVSQATTARRQIPRTLFFTAPGEVSNDCFSRMCSKVSRKGVPYRSNTGRGSRSVLDRLGNNVVPPGSAEDRLCLQFHSHPDQLPNPSFSPKPSLANEPHSGGASWG